MHEAVERFAAHAVGDGRLDEAAHPVELGRTALDQLLEVARGVLEDLIEEHRPGIADDGESDPRLCGGARLVVCGDEMGELHASTLSQPRRRWALWP
jgi:hypothetical protein